ncbi:MAG TPA: hypothetical protein VNA12_06485 [Mycobacteriales bacterium]|nr:hypothetical protein [Mycobacteriales bacterium]
MSGHSRRGVVTAAVTTGLLTLGLFAGGASAEPKDKPKDKPGSGSQQQKPEQAKDKPADKSKPADKPARDQGTNNGNPGTIKVAVPTDGTHNDNEPHPGCWARVDFYNFNPKTYGVEFTAIAPTAGGRVGGGTATITVPRTGGGGFQQSFTFALDFTGIAPAKQGYHVKVRVTNPDKPGNGAKSKVFWLDCVPAPAATTASGSASVLGEASVRGFRGALRGDDSGTAQVLGVRLERVATSAAAGATTDVAAAAVAKRRTGVLPFTGAELIPVVFAGLLLVVVGTGLVRVSRETGLLPAR